MADTDEPADASKKLEVLLKARYPEHSAQIENFVTTHESEINSGNPLYYLEKFKREIIEPTSKSTANRGVRTRCQPAH